MTAATKLSPTKAQPDPRGKFSVLVSYAFLRECSPEAIAWLLNNPTLEILLDSGAFSALNAGKEIKLDDYLRFLAQWKDKLFGYIALDVLGDPKQTELNLQVMLRQGFKPVPVHVLGDDGKRMDQLFELSDWVACGGLRRPQRGSASKEYVKQKMLWAKGRNVHWLGYTSQKMLEAFRPFSADCSNWNTAQQWGLVQLYHSGKMMQWRRYNALTKPLELPMMQLLQEAGFTSADWRDLDLWRMNIKKTPMQRFMAMQVTTLSWVKYIRAFRARFGTRIFLATALLQGDAESITRWVNATLPTGQQAYTVASPNGADGRQPA